MFLVPPTSPKTFMKCCSKCKLNKPFSSFSKNKGGKFGLRSECRECRSSLKVHRKYMLVKYSLSESEYLVLQDNQGGLCAICGSLPEGKSLAVDHNHLTGEVRGLLCSNCNTALGLLKENLDILKSMVLYLERHNHRWGNFVGNKAVSNSI